MSQSANIFYVCVYYMYVRMCVVCMYVYAMHSIVHRIAYEIGPNMKSILFALNLLV